MAHSVPQLLTTSQIQFANPTDPSFLSMSTTELSLEILRNDDLESLERYTLETGNYDTSMSSASSGNFEILAANPSLLSIAAFFGAVQCFEYLQMSGADMTKADDMGRLPVHFAAAGGSLEICDVLDGAGADFTVHDAQDMGCVHYACLYAHVQVLQRLETRALPLDDPRLVLFAAKHETTEVMEYLLEHGCDINANVGGETPFLLAFKHSPAVLRFLLQHGVDTNVIVKDDRTALMDACYSGDLNIVNILLEFGNDGIDYQDHFGWTALLYACSKGHGEVVQKLVECHADVNKKSFLGFSPWMAAHNNNHQEIVKFLSDNGALPRPS